MPLISRNPNAFDLDEPAAVLRISATTGRVGFMKLDEIVVEASKLSEEERASLASQLLHGLETPFYEVSDEEVRQRMREADADPSVLITFDELVARLRRRGT